MIKMILIFCLLSSVSILYSDSHNTYTKSKTEYFIDYDDEVIPDLVNL